ncbi:Uncharacterized protein DAT39_018229 [Clarias magur]|uniref:Uncharacterized protein n=1 Tax=Clarias magur TaxID=1594786 RepID=A0A8J4WV91_CLAMG|nr:Uncharacterized protein DAT39_018229 [Clarias magur]
MMSAWSNSFTQSLDLEGEEARHRPVHLTDEQLQLDASSPCDQTRQVTHVKTRVGSRASSSGGLCSITTEPFKRCFSQTRTRLSVCLSAASGCTAYQSLSFIESCPFQVLIVCAGTLLVVRYQPGSIVDAH